MRNVAARQLVEKNGWAVLVSDGGHRDAEGGPVGGSALGPVVSHLPVVVEASADPAQAQTETPLTILGHLARADAETHRLGDREVVLIIQGLHGYVSPDWYVGGPYVPTWNFVVAHLHGRPEILDGPATRDVLQQTCDRFERGRPQPWSMQSVSSYADALLPHVTGFRLSPTRVVGKAKLSQDKPAEDIQGVITGLETDPVHANPALARAMRALGHP